METEPSHPPDPEHEPAEPAPERPVFDLTQLSDEQVEWLVVVLGAHAYPLEEPPVLTVSRDAAHELIEQFGRDLKALPARDVERAAVLYGQLARSRHSQCRAEAAFAMGSLLRAQADDPAAMAETLGTWIRLATTESPDGVGHTAYMSIRGAVDEGWLDEPTRQLLLTAVDDPDR